MQPTFFATREEFRAWLEEHHYTELELLVGFYRKGTGRTSISYPEAVEEALCFGWIDGVRRRIDELSYSNRFSPRRRGSTWSTINVRAAEELIRTGKMHPSGLRVYNERDKARSGSYSFEQPSVELGEEAEAQFRENAKAWSFFQTQPRGYRKTATWWVVSAKREDTRGRRLQTLIDDSAAGLRIGLLRRSGEP